MFFSTINYLDMIFENLIENICKKHLYLAI